MHVWAKMKKILANFTKKGKEINLVLKIYNIYYFETSISMYLQLMPEFPCSYCPNDRPEILCCREFGLELQRNSGTLMSKFSCKGYFPNDRPEILHPCKFGQVLQRDSDPLMLEFSCRCCPNERKHSIVNSSRSKREIWAHTVRS